MSGYGLLLAYALLTLGWLAVEAGLMGPGGAALVPQLGYFAAASLGAMGWLVFRQQQAQAALRRVQARQSLLLSGTSVILYGASTKPPYSATVVSPNLKRLLGHDPETYTADPTFWQRHVHPEDRERVEGRLAQVGEWDKVELEYRFRHADGSWRWMRDVCWTIPAQGGQPEEVVGYFLDVTELKQAEAERRASESNFAQVFRLSPDWMLIFDADRRVVEANQQFLLDNGLSLEQAQGKNLEELGLWVKPADLARVRGHLEHSLEASNLEVRLRDVRGRARIGLFSSQPMQLGGRPCAVTAIADITQRVELEEALRRSEEGRRLALELSNIGDWDLTLGTDRLEWSPQVYRLLGVDPQTFRPSSEAFHALIHPDDRDRFARYSERAVEELAPLDVEYRVVHPDGGLRWLQSRGQAICAEGGRPARMAGVVWDITERKLTELALQQGQARQEALLRAVPDLMFLHRRDGTFLDYNAPEGAKLLAPPEVFLGKTLGEVLEPGLAAALMRCFELALESGQPQVHQYVLELDGPHHFEARVVPTGQGELFTIVRDLTEDRQRAEALRVSEENFAKVFHASPAPTTVTTLHEGRFLEVNESFLRSTGFRRDELIGRTVGEVRVWETPETRGLMVARLLAGQAVRNHEAVMSTKTGKLRQVLVSAEIVEFAGQTCLLVIRNDITERKRAEERLRSSEERLALAFDAVKMGWWEWDAQTDRHLQSDSFSRLLGYADPSELNEVSKLLAVVHPEDRPHLEALIQTPPPRTPYEFDYRVIRPDGSLHWISSRQHVIRDPQGRVLRRIGIDVDITERKLAEERLRLSLELSNLGNWDLNIATGEMAWSPGVYRLLGVTPEGFQPSFETFTELIHPADRDRFTRLSELAMHNPITLDIDYRVVRPYEGLRWLQTRGRTIQDAEGRPVRMVGVVWDVTGRKGDELALQASEEQLRVMFEQAAVGIVRTTPEGHWLQPNPKLCQILGHSVAELQAVTWRQMTHPDHWAEESALIERLVAGELPSYSLEKRCVRRGGGAVWVRATVSALRDANGGVMSLITVVEDIDERKRLEAAVRQQELLYRTLAQRLPKGAVFVFDHELRFLLAEGQSLWEAGHRPAGVEGRTLYEVSSPDRAARLEGFYRAALAGQVMGGEAELQGQFYQLHTQPLLDAQGRVWAGMVVAYDITELKQAQQELGELNQRLETKVLERTQALAEINAELETFTATVSHDLRSPLRSIRGFSQILLEDFGPGLDPTAQDYLGRIEAAGQRMDTLISDLLAYSRLSHGELPLAEVGLRGVLEAALRNLEHEIAAQRATVGLAGPEVQVRANPGILGQVVVNLISNALKYVPEGQAPLVRLRTEVCGGAARLWVEDNGIGIAPEHQGRIFQPFERLHGVGRYGGTGIGLAIVRRGTARMGGRAGVESEVGRGSRFWIELPLAGEQT